MRHGKTKNKKKYFRFKKLTKQQRECERVKGLQICKFNSFDLLPLDLLDQGSRTRGVQTSGKMTVY